MVYATQKSEHVRAADETAMAMVTLDLCAIACVSNQMAAPWMKRFFGLLSPKPGDGRGGGRGRIYARLMLALGYGGAPALTRRYLDGSAQFTHEQMKHESDLAQRGENRPGMSVVIGDNLNKRLNTAFSNVDDTATSLDGMVAMRVFYDDTFPELDANPGNTHTRTHARASITRDYPHIRCCTQRQWRAE